MKAFADDYRELIEDARDAICKLLDESEHDSWSTLRIGYGTLRDQLTRDDKAREQRETNGQRQQAVRNEREKRDEIEDAWKRTPAATRESLLLQALGDERLTTREVTSRLNNALFPENASKYRAVYEGHTRALLTRMRLAGQLERTPESFKGKVRYLYSRKRALEGPILGLESAFRDGGEK